MAVSAIGQDASEQRTLAKRPQSTAVDFAQVLDSRITTSSNKTIAPPNGPENAPVTRQGPEASRVEIGTISSGTPTVSHLLHNQPAWKDDIWQIIHADVNRDKPFTQLRPGTTVYLDAATGELSWGRDAERATTNAPIAQADKLRQATQRLDALPYRPVDGAVSPAHAQTAMASPHQSDAIPGETSQAHTVAEPQKPVLLGTLSQQTPTVSHLLKKHPDYSEDVWKIVFSASNHGKTFSRMPLGTSVSIHPETHEISWPEEPSRSRVQTQPATMPVEAQTVALADGNANTSFASELARAVRPLYGTSYEHLDCYELVVRGLKSMGVRYEGQGGIRDHLVNMAAEHDLPDNAYLNGEGLVEAFGSKVYATSMGNIDHADTMAQQIFREMVPELEEGLILSFSTRSRGHTGIISQQDGLWTFINSGVMDHSISPGTEPERVGEEILSEEINNWLQLAATEDETLSITLGSLSQQKLQTALQQNAE